MGYIILQIICKKYQWERIEGTSLVKLFFHNIQISKIAYCRFSRTIEENICDDFFTTGTFSSLGEVGKWKFSLSKVQINYNLAHCIIYFPPYEIL
jgi:hypothetical protein